MPQQDTNDTPENEPYPSLNAIEFTEELLTILKNHYLSSGIPEHMVTSLILRYDNAWIGSVFGAEEDGLINLMELTRVHLGCASLDKRYSKLITPRIEPPVVSNALFLAKLRGDYTRPATLAQIGNVTISFILHEINQTPKTTLSNEDEIERYGGTYPDTLDINESGVQSKKIFFTPRIQVVGVNGAYPMSVDWSGRALPGQSVADAITLELKEVYSYTGKFEWRKPYFKEWKKDNKGNSIQCFGILVLLYPTDTDLKT